MIDHIAFKSGIRTDGLTMSLYRSFMVAATPTMNAVFMALLSGAGYDATVAAQTAGVQGTITVRCIWIETVAYAVCALRIFLFTVEKALPEEQAAISG